MLLYTTFTSLQLHSQTAALSHDECHTLSHHTFTTSDLTLAQETTTRAYRCFALDNPEHAAELRHAYNYFLALCEQALQQQSEPTFLPLVFDVLDNQHQPTQLNALIQFNLKTQHDALALAPLGRQFIEFPHVFSAFLTWLTIHGAGHEDLMATHMVQDYVGYYLNTFDDPTGPIQALYTGLAANPQTKKLAEALSETSCPEEDLRSYALDGQIRDSSKLKNPVKTHVPKHTLTPTQANMIAMTRVFGIHALTLSLKDPQLTAPLKHLLNNESAVRKHLPELLHHIQSDPKLKSKLAALLDPTTLDALVHAHVSGVLSLLPYAPHLRKKIGEQELSTYLLALKKTTPSNFDLVSDLSALFDLFKKQNETRAILIYDEIIQAVMLEPSLLEDDVLRIKLEKFRLAEARLTKQLDRLESLFDLTLEASLKNFDYIDLGDVWYGLLSQAQAIQTIAPIPHTFPMNTCQLQGRVGQAFFKQDGIWFDLDKLAPSLRLERVFHPKQVTPYERFLIELLTRIDDPNFRQGLVAHLDSQNLEARAWRQTRYNDRSLAYLACQQGNLGLIQWLEAERIKHPHAIDTLSILSANLKHWPLAHHFHRTYALKQTTVDELLHLAVEQEVSANIAPLWQPGRRAPRQLNIETALGQALTDGRFACIQALLVCPAPPRDKIITQRFKQALNMGEFAIATQLAEVKPQKQLHDAANQALLDAVRSTHKQGIVSCLKNIKLNQPSQATIGQALKRAARSNNLPAVKVLCHFGPSAPRIEAKQHAWQEAEKKGYTSISTYLAQEGLPAKAYRHRTAQKGSSASQKKATHTKQLGRTQSCNSFIGEKPPSVANLGLFSPCPTSPSKRTAPPKPEHTRQIFM